MKRTTAFLAAIAFCAVCSTAYALYRVANEGLWPKSWPEQLEPLRARSRTLVGPMVAQRHYEIPFTERKDFEAAWPHLLKAKSKGAPVILLRPDEERFITVDAGVVIHSPPTGQDKRVHPEAPTNSTNVRTRWMWTTYIELVVDGEIVDLNRISLPAETPIIDMRFEDVQSKTPDRDDE